MVAAFIVIVYTSRVTNSYEQKVESLSPEKALAIGMYGESVASYRYRVLAEKVQDERLNAIFLEMADEEHGHHALLQEILKKRFPDSDFVLSPDDKDLIIVGPRMLELGDGASPERALQMIYDSERLTGKFYATLHHVTPIDELKPILQEMADECFEHAEKLLSIDWPKQP
ncbi:MAG: ferritin family protein [Planctomycetota bacterium]